MLISFLFREEAILKLRMRLRRFLGLRIVCLALEIIVSEKYLYMNLNQSNCRAANQILQITKIRPLCLFALNFGVYC